MTLEKTQQQQKKWNKPKTFQCQTARFSFIFSLASSESAKVHALYGSGKLDATIAISSLTKGFCSTKRMH